MKNSTSVFPSTPRQISLLILRIVMGIIFISHGVARLYYGSIPDFGAFLDSRGLMIGELIAWAITIGEIIGGMLLISGFFIRYAVIFHIAVVLTGIFLVHFPNGWFVVGHGQNGIEYSILILAVLIYLFSQSISKTHS